MNIEDTIPQVSPHFERRPLRCDAQSGKLRNPESKLPASHSPALQALATLAGLPIARRIAASRNVLFIGRGTNYPHALEGALKLKEITYIHAEGCRRAEARADRAHRQKSPRYRDGAG